MSPLRYVSLCALFAFAGMLLLVVPFGTAKATTARNYTFPSIPGLSGVLDRKNDTCIGCTIAQLSETISIIVTNNTGTRYSCEGVIRYRQLNTGSPDAFANSGTKIVEPFSQATIVSARKFLSDGRGLDLQATSLSCAADSGGGSGGGGGGGSGAIDMSGRASYETIGGEARLSIARIENNTDGATGMLYLVLRANSSDSVTSSGFNLTNEILVGSLGINQFFSDVSVTGSYSPPPDGQYFIYMILVRNGLAVDWVRFDPKTFSSSPGGGGGGGSGGGDDSQGIELEGSVSIVPNWSAGTIAFNVERVVNKSDSRTTGTLRLALWATTEPYQGGNISGYRVATYQFVNDDSGRLPPRSQYFDISRTVQIASRPPAGSYYAAVIVSEFQPGNCGSVDEFCIVAYRSFSEPLTVPAPSFSGGGGAGNGDFDDPGTGTSTGGGGDGGGGGSASLHEILMLLFIVALIKAGKLYSRRRELTR